MQEAEDPAFIALRRSFIEGLEARLVAIRGPDAEVRDQALHKLAGAAGAYGLDFLSEQARRIEAAVRSRNSAAVEAGLDALTAQVAALRAGHPRQAT